MRVLLRIIIYSFCSSSFLRGVVSKIRVWAVVLLVVIIITVLGIKVGIKVGIKIIIVIVMGIALRFRGNILLVCRLIYWNFDWFI